MILISLTQQTFGQSTIKVKMYAQEAAENLMDKISPTTGKNASYEIFDADFDSYKNEYIIEMSATWQGSPCWVCDETTFEIRGFLTVNSDGSNPRFKQTYKNSAVENSETWSKVGDGLIILANAIDEQNSQNQSTTTYSNSTSSAYSSSSSTSLYGSFTDSRDGKTYKTVRIGNQTWMAENLAYKPNTVGYWAPNNNASTVSNYGYLYNYKTATTVCPSGWHLPLSSEWNILTDYVESKKDNIFLTQLAGERSGNYSEAYKHLNGTFDDFEKNGYWWIIYNSQSFNSYSFGSGYYIGGFKQTDKDDNISGFSVRCVKDK